MSTPAIHNELGEQGAGNASPAAQHGELVCQALQHHASRGALTLKLQGDCMAPFLHDGQQVAIRPKRRYWPGDLVIVQSVDGRLLCHRLLGWYRRQGQWRWLTQADIARRPDYSVPGSQVIGAPACNRSGKYHAAGGLSRISATWNYLRWLLGASRRRLRRAWQA